MKLYEPGKQQTEPDGLYTVKPDHGDLPQGCVFKRYRGRTCRDKVILSKCRALKVKSIPEKEARRYVMSALEVVQKLESIDPSIEVNNLGESDFIIAYKPPKAPEMCWQWLKTFFVCLVSFFGAAFAIMTFNNDVNVGDVLSQVYFQVMGRQPDGFGLMEAGYSVGLAIGILVFFNHIAVKKLNTDPTPFGSGNAPL